MQSAGHHQRSHFGSQDSGDGATPSEHDGSDCPRHGGDGTDEGASTDPGL